MLPAVAVVQVFRVLPSLSYNCRIHAICSMLPGFSCLALSLVQLQNTCNRLSFSFAQCYLVFRRSFKFFVYSICSSFPCSQKWSSGSIYLVLHHHCVCIGGVRIHPTSHPPIMSLSEWPGCSSKLSWVSPFPFCLVDISFSFSPLFYSYLCLFWMGIDVCVWIDQSQRLKLLEDFLMQTERHRAKLSCSKRKRPRQFEME